MTRKRRNSFIAATTKAFRSLTVSGSAISSYRLFVAFWMAFLSCARIKSHSAQSSYHLRKRSLRNISKTKWVSNINICENHGGKSNSFRLVLVLCRMLLNAIIPQLEVDKAMYNLVIWFVGQKMRSAGLSSED